MSSHSHRNPVFERVNWVGRILLLVIAASLCLGFTQPATAQVTPSALPNATRISGAAATDGPVESYKIASTGKYAVYETFKSSSGEIGASAFYSVTLDGGQPVQLNHMLGLANNDETTFDITPNGTRVLFTAYTVGAPWCSLFVVPIQGGQGVVPTQMSKPGMTVLKYQISPSGQWIVYYTKAVSWGTNHLYRVGISGSYNTTEEITFPAGAKIDDFIISPDSQRIVFRGQLTSAANWGVYVMPLTGSSSQAVPLTRPMDSPYSFDYYVTPDSQHLIYNYSYNVSGTINNRFYMVPLAGTASDDVLVSGDMVSGGKIKSFVVSPNSQWLVFVADKELKNKFELYSVYLPSGPNPKQRVVTKLNPTLPGMDGVSLNNFSISPDSTRVVFTAKLNTPYDLFVAPLNGPAATTPLNKAKVPNHAAFGPVARFTLNGQHIVYTSVETTEDVMDLYSIPSSGPSTAAVQLNPGYVPAQISEQVHYVLPHPDSTSVFFTLPPVTGSGRIVLYYSPITGPAAAARPLSASIDNVAVSMPSIVPNTNMVIYLQKTNGAKELYAVGYGAVYLPLISR